MRFESSSLSAIATFRLLVITVRFFRRRKALATLSGVDPIEKNKVVPSGIRRAAASPIACFPSGFVSVRWSKGVFRNSLLSSIRPCTRCNMSPSHNTSTSRRIVCMDTLSCSASEPTVAAPCSSTRAEIASRLFCFLSDIAVPSRIHSETLNAQKPQSNIFSERPTIYYTNFCAIGVKFRII